MTPQQTATAAAREIVYDASNYLNTVGKIKCFSAIILKHYASLEQELEQYKAVAKELAESINLLNHHTAEITDALTKFNNLEAKDKKG